MMHECSVLGCIIGSTAKAFRISLLGAASRPKGVRLLEVITGLVGVTVQREPGWQAAQGQLDS